MKKVIALMAALVLVTLVGSFAQGQTCYQLKPFIDIINLSHTTVGPNRVLFGNWTAGTEYSLPVVGAREPNINGGPNRVSLNGTNNNSDFGGIYGRLCREFYHIHNYWNCLHSCFMH